MTSFCPLVYTTVYLLCIVLISFAKYVTSARRGLHVKLTDTDSFLSPAPASEIDDLTMNFGRMGGSEINFDDADSTNNNYLNYFMQGMYCICIYLLSPLHFEQTFLIETQGVTGSIY